MLLGDVFCDKRREGERATLLPLNRAGGFAGDVVDDAVDGGDFVDDAVW
jgi:hypothetical protein